MIYARLVVAALIVFVGTLSGWCGDALWPLAGKPVITSTFGEFRLDHPHAGLDIRSKPGAPVLSPASGCVWRIKTTSYGCGKALYIRGDDGNIYVFFHLAGFARGIFDRLFAEQIRTLRYPQDLFLKPGELPVRRGEVVGYAGRTGTYVVHLHYEVRGPDNCPVNPLVVHAIADSTPPAIRRVALVPLRAGSTVDGSVRPAIRKVEGGTVRFRASGAVGLACEIEDSIPPSDRPLAPYRVAIRRGGDELFSVQFDRFCYEDRSIEFLIYHYGLLGSGRFLRLYSPDAVGRRSVSVWSGASGVLDVSGDQRLTIEACDIAGNCSSVDVAIERDGARSGCSGTGDLFVSSGFISFCRDDKRQWIGCGGSGELKIGERTVRYGCLSAGGSIEIGPWIVRADEGSLFGRQMVAVERVGIASAKLALKPVSGGIRLAPDDLMPDRGLEICYASGADLPREAGIYGIDGKDLYPKRTSRRSPNELCARVKRSGVFAVLVDNIKPEIGRARIVKGGLPEGWFIEFALSDAGSGIDDRRLAASFDDTPLVVEWVPFEGIARARLHFAGRSGPKAGTHRLAIAVADRAGNVSTIEQTIEFQPVRR